MNYLWNVLEALSQLLHAVLGGNPNITVSAAVYLKRDSYPWLYRGINAVFFWQEDHCRDSWLSDIMFAQQAMAQLGTPKSAPATHDSDMI